MRDHRKHLHSVDFKTIAWHAMEKYGFEPRFPPGVIDDVNTMKEEGFSDIPKDTRDLRTLLWSSVDNHDSQDLDQLEYCERTPEGMIRVLVAIADVDFYVQKHSPADEYAAHNGATIYTGVLTFPMLPERLSHGITSLLPGKERMAVVLEFLVRNNGSFSPGDVYQALVCNKAKLVYEEVGEWLEGRGALPKSIQDVPGLKEQLHLQNEATQLLRKYRRDQGALEFDTEEPEVVIENGVVRGLAASSPNAARALIEEFMVAANGTMVARLAGAGVPMIQRAVRSPRNWAGITLTAAIYGETLPEMPDAKALAKFLIRQKTTDPRHFPDLSLAVIKLMGSAEYVMLEPGAAPAGHFALAVIDYTHATAPNRQPAPGKSDPDRKTRPVFLIRSFRACPVAD
jgi:exoribonuclease-2